MSPILAGLFSALAFAGATMVSARASRLTGAIPAVAGAMLVIVVILVPVALVVSPLPPVGPEMLGLAALSGFMNTTGLVLIYSAYRIGAVGIVSTIVSTDGAIAAVISVVAGESLAPGSGPVLAVIALGVVVAATSGGHELEDGVPISRTRSLQAAGLALAAAIVFGAGMFLTANASSALPVAWVLLPGRVAGLVILGIALIAARRARVERAAIPFVVVAGILEIVGFAAFMIGAQADIAVTSILSSMFAPIAAVAAFILFRERLAGRQVAGIVLVVTGIALLGTLAG